MTATDLAVVIIAVAALATVALVVVLVIQLRRTTEKLRETVDAVHAEIAHTMAQVASQSSDVDAELRRAEGLLDTAERVSARADTLSRVTYGAVAKPVIKTAAVVRGTSRAARRLRRGADDGSIDTDTG